MTNHFGGWYLLYRDFWRASLARLDAYLRELKSREPKQAGDGKRE